MAPGRHLQRAGLPVGVLNLVVGRGRDIGDTITGSEGVDAVSFTGSTGTGARVLASAQAQRARVQLETGGKNPMLVLDDADLDVAVEQTLQSAFGSTGQRCTASSRLVVTDKIHDAFVEALLRRMDQMVVGDARDPGTQMGPVVDGSQLEADIGYRVSQHGRVGGSPVAGRSTGGPVNGRLLPRTGTAGRDPERPHCETGKRYSGRSPR